MTSSILWIRAQEMLHGLSKGIQKISRVTKFNLIGFRTGMTLRRGGRVSHSLLRGCSKFKYLTPSIPLFILNLCAHFYSSNSWVPQVLQDRPPIHPFSWPYYLLTNLKFMPHHCNGLLRNALNIFATFIMFSWKSLHPSLPQFMSLPLLEKNTQLADFLPLYSL